MNMKVIGVVRSVEDAMRYKDLNFKDGEVWDIVKGNPEELVPCVLFMFENDEDYVYPYNEFARMEGFYDELLRDQEMEVLDKLLDNLIDDTIYSSTDYIIKQFLDKISNYGPAISPRQLLATLFKVYNEVMFIRRLDSKVSAFFNIKRVEKDGNRYTIEAKVGIKSKFIDETVKQTDVIISYNLVDNLDGMVEIMKELVLTLNELVYRLNKLNSEC